MSRKNDWSHPLPFGDSMWVKKSDVEPLVRAVRKMLDEVYEFGSVVSNEYVELAESAYIKLVGDEPPNTGLQPTGGTRCWSTCSFKHTGIHETGCPAASG